MHLKISSDNFDHLAKGQLVHTVVNKKNYHTRPIVSRGADYVYESPLCDSSFRNEYS